jgi:uncharacterized membrane protein YczE
MQQLPPVNGVRTGSALALIILSAYSKLWTEAAVKSIVLVARLLISLFGITLLVLGILFWTGHALSLLQLHAMLGGLFVICLWVLAVIGFIVPGSRPLALIVLIWSLIVPAVGVMQLRVMPGADHWVIQVTHLLVGLIAMGLGHALARRIGRQPTAATGIPENA